MFSLKSPLKFWDDFFFTPKPTEGIAFFRIVWISLLSIYYLVDLTNIVDFFGPHALISLQTAKQQFPYLHANVFHLFNTSYETVYVLLAIYGLALFFSLIGFYTRSSLIVVLVLMTSFHQRNIWLLSSSELLMRLMTTYLIFSPCGHSLSLDSFLGRKYPMFRKEKMWAPWALRLIQIQLSVVYIITVWQKLQGEDWIDGTALYYATRIQDMTNFPVPFLLDSTVLIAIMTWGTLLLELALGVLLWFKETRKPVILLGIAFHLGIEYAMTIPFFELVMIVLLINFYTPEELRDFVFRVRNSIVEGIRKTNISENFKQKIIAVCEPINDKA